MTATLILDVQRVCEGEMPDDKEIEDWLSAALLRHTPQHLAYEVCVRLVSADEIAELNQRYRSKTGATNVLSFPFEAPDFISEAESHRLLGDIVVCPQVIAEEAAVQGKALMSHWTHIIMHGALHLLGYDHETQEQAARMEAIEIETLARFNINNPYLLPE